jgi:Rrf2 family cysteine metabolism transcriptional repressor
MRLSRKGEYALRAMIRLSLNYGEEPLRIVEISEREKIPKKFLEQILLELKKAGLLRSRRGAGGGYSLIRPPREITFAQVIRIIDGPLAPLGCVSKHAYVSCPDEKSCGLYRVMLDVRNATARILEGVTFADACRDMGGSVGGKRGGKSRRKSP